MNGKMNRWVMLGLSGAVMGIMVFASPAGAAEGQGRGQGQRQRGERMKNLLDGAYAKRIDERIAKIKERLEKHPNLPADIKAAAEKLIGDLTALKGSLDKLVAAIKAKDREAAKAAHVEVKAAREQVRADRKALHELIQKYRQERRGGEGAKK